MLFFTFAVEAKKSGEKNDTSLIPVWQYSSSFLRLARWFWARTQHCVDLTWSLMWRLEEMNGTNLLDTSLAVLLELPEVGQVVLGSVLCGPVQGVPDLHLLGLGYHPVE